MRLSNHTAHWLDLAITTRSLSSSVRGGRASELIFDRIKRRFNPRTETRFPEMIQRSITSLSTAIQAPKTALNKLMSYSPLQFHQEKVVPFYESMFEVIKTRF